MDEKFELEPVVRDTYTLLPQDNNEGKDSFNTKLQLEDEEQTRKKRTKKDTADEYELDSVSRDEGELELNSSEHKQNSKLQDTITLESVLGQAEGLGDKAERKRERVKPKKRVSWIDLEKGRTSAVTQVYAVDSPLRYDRRPAPMGVGKNLQPETRSDKVLIWIIIALIVVILVRFQTSSFLSSLFIVIPFVILPLFAVLMLHHFCNHSTPNSFGVFILLMVTGFLKRDASDAGGGGGQ